MEKAEAENKNEEAKTPKVIARKPQSVHKQSVINSFSLDKQIIQKKFDLKKRGGIFLSQKLFFFRFIAKDPFFLS